jgi:hypothetical protein
MIRALKVWEFESWASGRTQRFWLARLGRFQGKADVNQPTPPVESIENNPERTNLHKSNFP